MVIQSVSSLDITILPYPYLVVSSTVRAIEENIVGFLVGCTLLVWVPLSLLINCVS